MITLPFFTQRVKNEMNDDLESHARIGGLPDAAPSTARDSHQVQLAVPEWWNVYEGLTDAEIHAIDEIIRQRAYLTREFDLERHS